MRDDLIPSVILAEPELSPWEQYKENVAEAASSLAGGEGFSWKLARLTAESTLKGGGKPRDGLVSMKQWCEDVQEECGRLGFHIPYSPRTGARFKKTWVNYANLAELPAFYEVYIEVSKPERAEFEPPSPLPDGIFDLIYADPPWQYEHSKTHSRDIENQYPTLELEDIKELTDIRGRTVTEIIAEDSLLLLWATAPKLIEALEVMDAWGFTYRSCLVWVKDKIGMGYWARGRHELLLVGVKGEFSPPEEGDRPDSVIEAPRGRHSEKPEEVYEMIESMFPWTSKVELFSRSERVGWTPWGNEVS